MADGVGRVALLGATGIVGGEVLQVLEERRFPLQELVAFASEASAGDELEYRGEALDVEPLLTEATGSPGAPAWLDFDLVICAAPRVLEPHAGRLDSARARGVDVSGALELDPSVPIHRLGSRDVPPGTRWVSIPRGPAAAVGLVLEPLAQEFELERASVVTFEPASGAGRDGVAELSDQTVALLNAMTGATEDAVRFPRSLAFDCLPQVGLPLEGGETSEEQRLRHVVRRWLERPALELSVTRVRVPVFSGSLAVVHAELSREPELEQVLGLWEGRSGIALAVEEDELPTSRGATGGDAVLVGRVRLHERQLGCVVACDDLRPGSALAAVEAAEALFDQE